MRHLLAPYFSLKGRSSRREWWIVEVLAVIGLRANEVLFEILLHRDGFDLGHKTSQTWVLVIVLLLWLMHASNVRRLHDRGKSGWWALLYLIPGIGQLWCIAECGFMQGQPQPNKYGPPPGTRTIYQTLAGQMIGRSQALKSTPATPAPAAKAAASSIPAAPLAKPAGRRVSVLESSAHRPTVQRGSARPPIRLWRVALALAALVVALVGLGLTDRLSVVPVGVNTNAPATEPAGQP